jgi:HPt (histidine-containing phosphotransfer) domain-containing protein
VEEGDLPSLSACAHSIKGSAVNFGARPLGRLAAELEQRARAGVLAEAGDRVKALEAEFLRVQTTLTPVLGPRA